MQNQLQAYRNAYLSYYIYIIPIHIIFRFSFSSAVHRFFYPFTYRQEMTGLRSVDTVHVES